MKRHLNSQNATKCSTVTTCKSVKHFTVSLCSFTLYFVKKIDGWKLQKDNFMKVSVCSLECDGVENEAIAPG